MSVPNASRFAAGAALCISILLAAAGCATVPADFRQPGVSVVSVTPRLANSIAPEFDIVLRVTNPNRSALAIKGLTYTIDLAGSQVVQGVASDLPKIAAYGEAEVTLGAQADLLGGLNVLSRILADPASPIDFEFNAEIDIGTFYPMIRVNKRGEVSFR
jgi:LEA14-like dessication related protein